MIAEVHGDRGVNSASETAKSALVRKESLTRSNKRNFSRLHFVNMAEQKKGASDYLLSREGIRISERLNNIKTLHVTIDNYLLW